eukprot:m.226239 g.226239  ORF g.226239 m.226239 type:complete len:78 (+) comp15964_c0_seq19:111-344(+)
MVLRKCKSTWLLVIDSDAGHPEKSNITNVSQNRKICFYNNLFDVTAPTIEEIYGYLSTAVRLIAGEGKVFHFFHSSV